MAARRAVVRVARLYSHPLSSSTSGLLTKQPQYSIHGAFTAHLFRNYSSLPAHTKLAMPALSPTMTQGNIAKWYVKVGDEIAAGTVLADIETDKATLAFENQEDGFIAAIVMPEGSKDVPVGETVAIVVEESADIAAFANYSGDAAAHASPAAAEAQPASAAAPAEAPAASAAAAGASSSDSWPEHTPLHMPALSPTMEQGNIVSWQVKEGDEVAPGTVLAEIETDKATLAFENQDEGFIAKIVAPAGSKDIKVGQLVAIIVEDKEQVAAFANFTEEGAAATTEQKQAAPAAAPEAAAVKPPSVQANFRLGPAARKALQEAGLTADDVTPSGPNNIVTKWDVLQAMSAGVKPGAKPAPAAAAAPPEQAAAAAPAKPAASAAPAKPAAGADAGSADGAAYIDVPNSQVRKIIAKRLLESKLTAPSLYVTADVNLNKLTDMRKSMAAQGTKVSVNDFIVRAVALALRDVPEANAYWDKQQEATVQQPSVDVCIAVATDGGLITPIVKSADGKNLMQISAEVKDLAARARANKLKPEEFMGGSFSISNLGMYGLTEFSAIINPPQAGILAVGGTQQQLAVGEHGGLVNNTIMTVTLTADHRVFDGELSSRFLHAFTGYMETPLKLMF